MQYRFAVGSQDGPRSDSWKLWSQGNEVYLANRNLADVHKFSFHKSGINRWAFIHEPPTGRIALSRRGDVARSRKPEATKPVC
jgi:hypothetical protein